MMSEGDISRFRSKVDPFGPVPSHRPELGPCHLWTGSLTRSGYGRFWLSGTTCRAHRVAFFIEQGRWPEPCGLHKCDNPLCCNAQHVLEGTNAENSADMVRKGRAARGDRNARRLYPERTARGERNRHAKLTEQQVRDIRANYALCRVTPPELSARFGVSTSSIHRIVSRRMWSHVA